MPAAVTPHVTPVPKALNPDQEAVASHVNGRAWVAAGPGSGKTATITARIGRLLDLAVSPRNILGITFTNQAADEMKTRVKKQYGDKAKGITLCTFHSLCVRILKEFGSSFGYDSKTVIWDQNDQKERMKKAARQQMATDAPSGDEEGDKDKGLSSAKINTFCKIANDWRENLGGEGALLDYVNSGQINDAELAIIKDYLKRMRSQNSIDFSGLLSECYRLLKSDEDVRLRLQGRFKYIQVDEYQDTNLAQHSIVELLTGPDDNVLAVGDLDQSIYGWRGAKPEGIETFINTGNGKHGTAIFTLAVNYRSTPEIIAIADKLIKHNVGRRELLFTAHNTSIGKPPVLQTFAGPREEAEAISVRIAEYIRKGITPDKVAVFYRMNDMSREIEQALMRRNIPYRVIGGMGFYDRMEVKDCLAILRLLENPKDGASFTRIATRIVVGLGEKTVGAIENHAEHHNVDLIKACEEPFLFLPSKTPIQIAKVKTVKSVYEIFNFDRTGMAPADCLFNMINKLKYKEWVDAHSDGDIRKAAERMGNVNEMITSLAEFCTENPGSGLGEYLDYVSLLTTGDDDKQLEAVSLMSGHASKGKEFDVVFSIGIEKNILPHSLALRDRPDIGLAEERRLLYVMMTRAKKLLLLSWCKQRMRYGGKGMKTEDMGPSHFLCEAGLMSQEDYTKHLMRARIVDDPGAGGLAT